MFQNLTIPPFKPNERYMVVIHEISLGCPTPVSAFCGRFDSPKDAWQFGRALYPNERQYTVTPCRLRWLEKGKMPSLSQLILSIIAQDNDGSLHMIWTQVNKRRLASQEEILVELVGLTDQGLVEAMPEEYHLCWRLKQLSHSAD